jgi:hypothetical protein
MAPVNTMPAPAADAQAPVLTPPAASVTPQAAVDASMEAVHLTSPAGANTSNLPDVSQVSGAPEDPVNLVPPSENTSSASSSSHTHALPQSRYAGHRDDTDGSGSN